MTGQQPKHQGNVVPLNRPPSEPSRARLATVQQWHQDMASSEDQAVVAAIHLCITTAGVIQTEGICIEPEHAQAMLEAIPNLIARLESVAGIRQPAARPHSKLIHQLMARGSRSHQDLFGPTILWGRNDRGMSGSIDALIALNSART